MERKEYKMKKTFVKTNNVKNFISMMNNLQNRAEGVPGLGLVYGEPGLGKTYTIMWWAMQNSSIYIRCANNMNARWLLEEIVEEFNEIPHLRYSDLYNQTVKCLIERPKIILVDEVDYLTEEYKAVETLRDLHDKTNIEQKVSNDVSISDYYIKKQKNKFKEINFGNINCKIKDFTEEINISFESLDEYKNLDKKQKQRLRKILTILKLAGKLRGNELKKLLKELGKQNKESSISYPHFIKLKRKFIRYGINGILFHYGNNKGKTIIPQKMYDDFKKIYFSKNISIKDTLELLRQNNYKEKIPCAVTFGRMLNREFINMY